MPWSSAVQRHVASVARQAEQRRQANRQACALLAELVRGSAERLAMTGEEWRRGPVSGENIALLERYGQDVTAWCASNSLPIENKAAALREHVRIYGALLHTVVNHLRELLTTEHQVDLISRLNVCQLQLELERDKPRHDLLYTYLPDRWQTEAVAAHPAGIWPREPLGLDSG